MQEKLTSKRARLLVWLKELRAPFFTAVLIPVTLGAAVAWFSLRTFDPALFALSLLGVLCINAGTNLANDYFDYKSGCDSANPDFRSPFSGGSGLLPGGLLDPKKVHWAAIASFALAASVGVFLIFARGWIVAVLGLVGVLSGYFYTTKLATRGIGEVIVGINCGPLVVLGSYYVQTQVIALEPIAASVPLGILILGVLWINEIPDFNADLKAGKKTLVTRIGRKRATDVYCVLMAGTYLAVVLGVVSSLMPSFTLLSFLTAPLALRAMLVARRNYEAPQRLIPANAGTVMVHLLTGLILIGTYVIGGIAGL